MGFGRKSRHVIGGGGGHGEDLQITPLLDLFVALISFLLVAAVLSKVNVVDIGISKPVANPNSKPDPKSLNLSVELSQLEIKVLSQGKLIETVSLDSEGLWEKKFHSVLVDQKEKSPTDMKLRLDPKAKVSLELMMKVMDAARKLQPSDKTIIASDEKGQKVKLQYLFPQIILKGVY